MIGRKLTVIILLSLAVRLAEAVTPSLDCFLHLAALMSGESQKVELALSTYGKLLDSPTEPGAKHRLIEALAEAKDPFAVPDDGALISVKKHLVEFQRMLTVLRLNTAEVRARQLAVVSEKLAAQATAKIRIAQAVEQTVGVKEVSIETPQWARQTPDGRFFITVAKARNAGNKAIVYDGLTGKREEVELVDSDGIHPSSTILTSDGAKLVGVVHVKMTSGGGRVQALQIHEVANGKVSPTGKRILLKNNDGSEVVDEECTVHRIVPLLNPNWAVIHVQGHYRLVDLAAGTTHLFSEEPERAVTGRGGWESVRGRDALVAVADPVWPEKVHRVFLVEIGEGGKTAMRRIPLPPQLTEPEILDALGDSIALHEVNGESAYVVSAQNAPARRLLVPRPRVGATETYVLLHPNGKEMGVMGVDQGTSEYQVHWTNLVTNQKIGDFRLPMGSYKLSSDGESILVMRSDSVRVIPIHRHVEPKDRP